MMDMDDRWVFADGQFVVFWAGFHAQRAIPKMDGE
jgi:hypothetical protein